MSGVEGNRTLQIVANGGETTDPTIHPMYQLVKSVCPLPVVDRYHLLRDGDW